MLLLLLSSLTNFAVYCVEESEKPKEVIHMALFINYHPAYGSWVSKMVVLEFEDVEGLHAVESIFNTFSVFVFGAVFIPMSPATTIILSSHSCFPSLFSRALVCVVSA